MTPEEYKAIFTEDDAPGWDAITRRLKTLYPGQDDPLHWGTVIKHMLGGPDPLDGVSAFEHAGGPGPEPGLVVPPHLHFVTYGYSRLYYDAEDAGQEYSGFGFEMTLRLAYPLPVPRDASGGVSPALADQPTWVVILLQSLARYVFQTKRYFEPFQWADLEFPVRQDKPTSLTGFAFLPDPELAPIETPHGRVEFIQAYGLTTSELARIKAKKFTCRELIEERQRTDVLLVTDPDRRDDPDWIWLPS